MTLCWAGNLWTIGKLTVLLLLETVKGKGPDVQGSFTDNLLTATCHCWYIAPVMSHYQTGTKFWRFAVENFVAVRRCTTKLPKNAGTLTCPYLEHWWILAAQDDYVINMEHTAQMRRELISKQPKINSKTDAMPGRKPSHYFKSSSIMKINWTLKVSSGIRVI